MQRSPDGKLAFCGFAGGCTMTRPTHKFGAIRAHDDGWFTSKEQDETFCPEHVPDWVPAWRARKAAAVKDDDLVPVLLMDSRWECLDCEEGPWESTTDHSPGAQQHFDATGHRVNGSITKRLRTASAVKLVEDSMRRSRGER